MDKIDIAEAAAVYVKKNYNYLWLKTALKKGKQLARSGGGTLVTGSSHALNGIAEAAWQGACNCSMHSQDLYYDFACARAVMDGNARFQRCFIIFGYYIAYQDLSLSKGMRDYIVSPVYYPILKDPHNWKEPVARGLWTGLNAVPDEIKEACEKQAEEMVYRESSYYSEMKCRKPFFDLGGRPWLNLSDEEKDAYGKKRAEGHNSVLKYAGSYAENQEILRDYIHFLHLHDTKPIVIIPPFTKAYNTYVDGRLREAVEGLVHGVGEKMDFMDFNETELFEDGDFVDTDHLNEDGAWKMSRILAERFGG